MDEALKNQVINTMEYTYIKEIKNNYTMLLGVIVCDFLKNLIDRYGKNMAAGFEVNNL